MAIRRLVHAICSAIANWSAPKPTSEALVPVPVPPGTWLQVRERGSEIVRSFHYRCLCGQEYLYGADEAHVTKTHTCECCRREFNLLRSVDALTPDGNFKSDLATRLSNLAIKPFASAQQPRAPFLPVDWPIERVEWSGKKDSARERAFQTGDPGDMGPGF